MSRPYVARPYSAPAERFDIDMVIGKLCLYSGIVLVTLLVAGAI